MKNGTHKQATSKTSKPSNGKGKVTKAATKATKPVTKGKATTKQSKGFGERRFIFDHSVASVARALGKAGVMPSGAIAAIHKYQPLHSPAAIRSFVQAGKSGTRGDVAPLKKTELATLVKYAKAHTAGAAA
jgi:hypothetical protein